jgi:small subunit ribosomal protein S16
MAVALKLIRLGKKNSPAYRIVAVDRRSKRNGKYLEVVGFYNPTTEPLFIEVDQVKFDYWLEKGAIVSEGVAKLMKAGKLTKKTKIEVEKKKTVLGKDKTQS